MVAATTLSSTCPSLTHTQSTFLAALPRIVRHARCYFCHERCHHRRDDRVSEVVALAWKWWRLLVERHQDPGQFVSVLAMYAARAVRSGRQVCRQEWAKDALNERTQRRHGFVVGKLPDFSTLSTNPLAEALTDNVQSPVPDQVQFRLDFPSWLATHQQRDRAIALEMAQGESTQQLARRFRLSPARISQLRRAFHADWRRFTEDPDATGVAE